MAYERYGGGLVTTPSPSLQVNVQSLSYLKARFYAINVESARKGHAVRNYARLTCCESKGLHMPSGKLLWTQYLSVNPTSSH